MAIQAKIFGKSDENEYEGMESGRSFVPMFVAELNGLKQCKLSVPNVCSHKDITLLHLLFESQSKTSMLEDEAIIRTVNLGMMRPISLHDAYVLGYCMSLSRCQWKLELRYLGDEHIDMIK